MLVAIEIEGNIHLVYLVNRISSMKLYQEKVNSFVAQVLRLKPIIFGRILYLMGLEFGRPGRSKTRNVVGKLNSVIRRVIILNNLAKIS